MKILIVHNNYGAYSGEEAVVDQMAGLFQEMGHSVFFYRKSSESKRNTFLGNLSGFFSGIYSMEGVRGMREALDRYQPDVVNVHNLYPFISSAALRECQKRGIKVVMTVHNYRLICPTGLFMREGRACERCLERGDEWSCVRYNCEHSWARSIGFALRNAASRWRKDFYECVDRFACLTEFQRSKMIATGFSPEKIVVIPNFTEVDAAQSDCSIPNAKVGAVASKCAITPSDLKPSLSYIAYVGRLSEEKGYDLLLEVARRTPELEFRFAGKLREGLSFEELPNAKHVGLLNKQELHEFIQQSAFLVNASRCYEGFPMAALDAMKEGKAMVAPNHGGFPEIIGDEYPMGLLFEPGSVEELRKMILKISSDCQSLNLYSRNAYLKLSNHYLKENVREKWHILLCEVLNKY